MPGLRSTRPRLPMLALGATAILILAACGDEAPPPTPTEAVVATEAPQVEETATPEEPTPSVSRQLPRQRGPRRWRWKRRLRRVATPVAEVATPVVPGATPIAAFDARDAWPRYAPGGRDSSRDTRGTCYSESCDAPGIPGRHRRGPSGRASHPGGNT